MTSVRDQAGGNLGHGFSSSLSAVIPGAEAAAQNHRSTHGCSPGGATLVRTPASASSALPPPKTHTVSPKLFDTKRGCRSHAQPPVPVCALRVFSLIPQNKQDYFLIVFPPLLSFGLFFLPSPHPQSRCAGGKEPRLRRNSATPQLQAPAALLLSQSFWRRESEGIEWEGIDFILYFPL